MIRLKGLHDLLKDVPWENIFKLGASASAIKFCERIQVGTDVYTPHRKDQVKPHSSPWFLAACAATVTHKIHFICFYQQSKSSESKKKKSSDRLVITAKQFLTLLNLLMLMRQKSLSLPRNLGLGTSGELLMVL